MARCRCLQGVDKPHNPPIRTLSIGEGTGGARREALSVDGPSVTMCAMDGTSSGMTGFVAACHDDAEERKLPEFHEG